MFESATILINGVGKDRDQIQQPEDLATGQDRRRKRMPEMYQPRYYKQDDAGPQDESQASIQSGVSGL